jgi:hypothetical protein
VVHTRESVQRPRARRLDSSIVVRFGLVGLNFNPTNQIGSVYGVPEKGWIVVFFLFTGFRT